MFLRKAEDAAIISAMTNLTRAKSAEAASDQAVTSNAAVFTTGAGMQKQEKFFV